MRRITIRIDDDLYARLAAQAEQEHRSLNSQIIILIEQATNKATSTDEQRGEA